MSVVLSEHLPLLSTAPDGIQKLRGLILELAVRGKLVPQDPNDEPASELLKRIAKERARLEAEGTCKKSKPMPPVGEDDLPFVLPDGWAWIRLGQVGDWGAGATPLRSNPRYYGGSIPWFKSGELTADFISNAEEHVTELALKECSLRQNRTGDVLIAMYGATIGKTAILAKPATTNQAVCACTPNTGVFNRYLLTLLKALKPNFIGQGAGGAQPNISREKIVATVAALPPETEQHRIVAKVDELMVLCDRLEAEQADAEAAHTKLVETLLGTLTQSRDATELAANWQRLSQHFNILFTTESSLDALKQTILQLAVMGKLVSQDPNDEPASELLKRIAKERARLEAEGICKKSKATPRDAEDAPPFELPTGWVLSQLSDLTLVLNGRAYSKDELLSEGVPVLRVGNLFTSNHWYYSNLQLEEDKYCDKGDLLYSWSASFGPFIWQGPKVIYHYHIWKLCLFDESSLSKEFFYKFLLEKTAEIKAAGHGVSMIHMTKEKMEKILVPVPPLAEQHRIVAKVDELMVLCERLKADLVQSRSRQERLASILIESALAST